MAILGAYFRNLLEEHAQEGQYDSHQRVRRLPLLSKACQLLLDLRQVGANARAGQLLPGGVVVAP